MIAFRIHALIVSTLHPIDLVVLSLIESSNNRERAWAPVGIIL